MSPIRFQPLLHLSEDRLHVIDTDLAMVEVEHLDKTAHVGSLELLGKINIHVNPRHRMLLSTVFVLHHNRVADILDAHLVDGNLTGIRTLLHIGHRCHFNGLRHNQPDPRNPLRQTPSNATGRNHNAHRKTLPGSDRSRNGSTDNQLPTPSPAG